MRVISIAALSIASALALTISLPAQSRQPVIDVHMHALAANAQGPPPLGLCTPIDPFPAWDQRLPYAAALQALFKKPTCANPVWSPSTDEELMAQTIAAVGLRFVESQKPRGVVVKDVALLRNESPDGRAGGHVLVSPKNRLK